MTKALTVNFNDWEVRKVAGTDDVLAAPRLRNTSDDVVLFEMPAGMPAEEAATVVRAAVMEARNLREEDLADPDEAASLEEIMAEVRARLA